VVLIERPWARVKQPTTIPAGTTHELVAAMPIEQLAALLRDHLLPSGSAGPERAAWDQFWEVLRGDDELADRAFDVLEEFLDQAEDALDTAEGDDPQRRRMQKFHLNAQNAWQRLQKDPTVGRTVPTATRRLLAAITEHRVAVLDAGTSTAADVQLWNVLATVRASRRPPSVPDQQRARGGTNRCHAPAP